MKPTVLALFVATLTATAADFDNQQRRGDPKQDEKKVQQAERERKREAVKQFLAEKDKNKDNSVSRDEFLAGESDETAANAKFDEFNKNRDRFLTKSEIETMLGL